MENKHVHTSGQPSGGPARPVNYQPEILLKFSPQTTSPSTVSPMIFHPMPAFKNIFDKNRHRRYLSI